MDKENTTVEATETTDAFLDGWDKDEATSSETTGTENTESETSTEEAVQTGETQEDNNPDAPANVSGTSTDEQPEIKQQDESVFDHRTQQTQETPKNWTLRHLDEEKTVDEQELTALAQKGLDYDRIRTKYDESKPVMELVGKFAKDAGMPIADYIANIRLQAKKAAGLDEDQAKRAVDLEDREAALSIKETEDQKAKEAAHELQTKNKATEERRKADIEEFQKTFPDAAKDATSIPREVWDNVKQGQRLTVAYALWLANQSQSEVEKLKQDVAAKEQNARNAARSTGSMRSAGDESKASDSFLDGFGS